VVEAPTFGRSPGGVHGNAEEEMDEENDRSEGETKVDGYVRWPTHDEHASQHAPPIGREADFEDLRPRPCRCEVMEHGGNSRRLPQYTDTVWARILAVLFSSWGIHQLARSTQTQAEVDARSASNPPKNTWQMLAAAINSPGFGDYKAVDSRVLQRENVFAGIAARRLANAMHEPPHHTAFPKELKEAHRSLTAVLNLVWSRWSKSGQNDPDAWEHFVDEAIRGKKSPDALKRKLMLVKVVSGLDANIIQPNVRVIPAGARTSTGLEDVGDCTGEHQESGERFASEKGNGTHRAEREGTPIQSGKRKKRSRSSLTEQLGAVLHTPEEKDMMISTRRLHEQELQESQVRTAEGEERRRKEKAEADAIELKNIEHQLNIVNSLLQDENLSESRRVQLGERKARLLEKFLSISERSCGDASAS